MASVPLDKSNQRGKLTIFDGYFQGTGKSYAMLTRALGEQAAGRSVALAIPIDERWPETEALAESLEVLPHRRFQEGQRMIFEPEIEACLEAAPDLILLETLAYKNRDASRHLRRYQDVSELLQADIDVYTTFDITRLESLQEGGRSVLGRAHEERLPDRLFDMANEVHFIDLEPPLLLERLRRQGQGMLFDGLNAGQLSVDQLSALRAISLRRAADRAGLQKREISAPKGYGSREHFLVYLSAAPSNERLIRVAARSAKAFHGDFTALLVETAACQKASEADKERMAAHMHLAESMGATIEAVYGDDVALQIAEFARHAGVTSFVVDSEVRARRFFFRKASLADQPALLVPELYILVVPNGESSAAFSEKA